MVASSADGGNEPEVYQTRDYLLCSCGGTFVLGGEPVTQSSRGGGKRVGDLVGEADDTLWPAVFRHPKDWERPRQVGLLRLAAYALRNCLRDVAYTRFKTAPGAVSISRGNCNDEER